MPILELHGDPKRAVFLSRYSRELRADALTGQDFLYVTWSGLTLTDIWGDYLNISPDTPCWQYHAATERMFLEIAPGLDELSYDWDYSPALGMSGLIELVAYSTTGPRDIMLMGDKDGSTPYLYVGYEDGVGWHIKHYNGVSNVSATAVDTSITGGNFYTVRWTYYANGAVKIWVAENGGTETASSLSSALAPAAAWSENALHLGDTTTGGTTNKRLWVGLVAISADTTATLDQLQNLF